MSIRMMIAEHPNVKGHVNEPLAAAARHAMYCAEICTSCADACSAEEMDMRRCIRLCLDCADICAATAKVAIRRTSDNIEILRAMLQTCLQACEVCAANARNMITRIACAAPRCAANAPPIAARRWRRWGRRL